MDTILLCSHNPILVKSLYGILRDEGYGVELAEHPAQAVKMVMERQFSSIVIDPEPFGLAVDDAVKIIRTVRPEVMVVFVGHTGADSDALSIESPINLAEFRKAINLLHRMQHVN